MGFIVPASDGNFVVGMQSGLYRFDPASSKFTPITQVDSDQPHNRLNDGWEIDGVRLFLAPKIYGEAILIQYLVSRSHAHGDARVADRSRPEALAKPATERLRRSRPCGVCQHQRHPLTEWDAPHERQPVRPVGG